MLKKFCNCIIFNYLAFSWLQNNTKEGSAVKIYGSQEHKWNHTVKATAVKFNPEGKFHATVNHLFFLSISIFNENEEENCNVFISRKQEWCAMYRLASHFSKKFVNSRRLEERIYLVLLLSPLLETCSMRCFMLVALPSIFLLEYQELKYLMSILRGSYRLFFFSDMHVENAGKSFNLPSINYWEMLCPRFKYHDGQEALKSDITTTNERMRIIYRTKIAYLFDIIERCVYHITHLLHSSTKTNDEITD